MAENEIWQCKRCESKFDIYGFDLGERIKLTSDRKWHCPDCGYVQLKKIENPQPKGGE